MQITETSFLNEIEQLAQMIVEEYGYTSTDDEWSDGCHETADAHQCVIYYYHAEQVCNLSSSITDEGEEWLEGVYSSPYEGCETFGEVCVRLAYATILQHVQSAVVRKLEEMEEAA